ncbi:hypothetical protein [Sphingobacterium bambusae]|uniref:hypothetical protein n=1 Tax=Sphingobacterium bambusae TaxID=662858 RepID=UPI0036D40245
MLFLAICVPKKLIRFVFYAETCVSLWDFMLYAAYFQVVPVLGDKIKTMQSSLLAEPSVVL